MVRSLVHFYREMQNQFLVAVAVICCDKLTAQGVYEEGPRACFEKVSLLVTVLYRWTTVQTPPQDHPRNDERSQPGCRNISFDEKSGRTARDRLTMTGPQLPVEDTDSFTTKPP
ncbi:hypothetical protein GE21DRAFT_6642 [Neurospora crassa]|uniref:Uncharacterized protein n=1 Tax=Neurospora crassa (strain ATCC 24698 / 74-OR23-1A / CBS 708.71 / DSM 1257 / FGSC 987) TaxID=367110 RepID=Q7S8K1_NEUCR|nr:hypothetical protein NCU05284 [Neurospora crassa OR74A]EAA32685.1 hypothetical protein NCU05284 [Neurospora crassa OR74A]KHE84962.1 hypothetical protein GE21DRAFT_6642 [Neurospora crassa]|eukprot:XP_961921.1 hypothetical protein NCU05284 [Neurospora crassa OR74A]